MDTVVDKEGRLLASWRCRSAVALYYAVLEDEVGESGFLVECDAAPQLIKNRPTSTLPCQGSR
jgi:hypothetical protein